MAELWDKMPQESAKAWAAFQIYRDLPPHHDDKTKRRSQANTMALIGHKSFTMVAKWSSDYGWGERSRAYDAHMGTLALTFHEVEMERYQQHVIETSIQQLTVADRAVNKKLKMMLDSIEREESGELDKDEHAVDVIDLQRMAKTIENLDNLKRRIGRMATNYKSDTADDTPEDTAFIVEGG